MARQGAGGAELSYQLIVGAENLYLVGSAVHHVDQAIRRDLDVIGQLELALSLAQGPCGHPARGEDRHAAFPGFADEDSPGEIDGHTEGSVQAPLDGEEFPGFIPHDDGPEAGIRHI